jgi:hypothetical protein
MDKAEAMMDEVIEALFETLAWTPGRKRCRNCGRATMAVPASPGTGEGA